MVGLLAREIQANQRNLIRASSGTDSILDKEGERRERSQELSRFIELAHILESMLEVFSIEYMDYFLQEGGAFLLINALLLISNKLIRWEALYADSLTTPALITYLANFYGRLLQRTVGEGMISRQDFAERDFADIRIGSSKLLCEFVERVSRFEAIPRSVLTKDANLISKFETAPLLLHLIDKFKMKAFIGSLGPECV